MPMTDTGSVPQYKIEGRPRNTDPRSQKDKDYDVIKSSGQTN